MSEVNGARLRVKRIVIRNILGIEELEFEPGKVTLIEGANASGKSSVIEAMLAVAKGGHDATLIRKGAAEGEVVWIFDDDVEVTKTVRPMSSSLEARHPTMGRISAPQTYLNGLIDLLSVNPVAWMTADPKDRTRKLLEAMPLELPHERLAAAMEGTGLHVPQPNGKVHALELIDSATKVVYEERTGVNRVAKDARSTIAELRRSLPTGAGDGPDGSAGQASAIEDRKKALERKLGTELARIDVEAEKEIGRTREQLRDVTEKLREEIRAIEREAEGQIQEIRAQAEQRKQDVQIEVQPEINRLAGDVAAARERMKAAEAYANTRRMVDEARAKAETHEAQSKALTAALERLEALKHSLLGSLPIEGLTIEDGDVHLFEVPFPRLNTAEQIKLCVKVAELRAGKLGLVCVDGLERLDAEQFRLFAYELAASDLNAVVTRVTEGPLTVTALGAEGEVVR